MRCPYCRTPLTELAAECPGCQLDLKRAATLLGPVPRLEPCITDHCEALDRGEIKELIKRIQALQLRFPQVRIQVLFHHFPADHPFALYIFWIFNLGHISRDEEKAGNNRSILLAVDPIASKSAATIGYGLEPFLAEDALDHLLDEAAPAWTDQAWAEGVGVFLEGLGTLLEAAAHAASETFLVTNQPGAAGPGEF